MKSALCIAVVFATTIVVSAQGGGGGGIQEAGGDIAAPRNLNPVEQFASAMKIDAKTQGGQVDQIMKEAATEATPIGQEMLQLRQRMVNLMLQSQNDQAKPVVSAYADSAAKMTGIEARTFARVYEIVKPEQQKNVNASKAFDILTGLFQPASPRGNRGGGRGRGGAATSVRYELASFAPAAPQGRGSGGGTPSLGPVEQSRLDILETAFFLTKEQKNGAKTMLDDAHKNAQPIRDGLLNTRGAIVSALQARKPQPEIDAAVKAYAQESAAMVEAEMSAMAKVMLSVPKEQRANAPGVESVFFMMRGAFLDPKKWNTTPTAAKY